MKTATEFAEGLLRGYGSEYKEQSAEQVNNNWLVEPEQMTCNPVKRSQAGAPRSSTHLDPLIKSSTCEWPFMVIAM